MAVVRPFSCVRPAAEHAAEIAALPYDVYNREEAKREVKSHPLSFLAIAGGLCPRKGSFRTMGEGRKLCGRSE